MDGCIAPDHRVCVTLRHSCHTPPSSSKSGKLSSVNGIGGASNGILFWDGNHWASTISPDGVYRWNGAAWTVIAPDDPIRTIALDDRSQFEGLSPSSFKAPSQPLYKGNGLSIGSDWIASPGPVHWKPVAVADIEAVGITASTVGQNGHPSRTMRAGMISRRAYGSETDH